jgi:hypothetical protein
MGAPRLSPLTAAFPDLTGTEFCVRHYWDAIPSGNKDLHGGGPKRTQKVSCGVINSLGRRVAHGYLYGQRQ